MGADHVDGARLNESFRDYTGIILVSTFSCCFVWNDLIIEETDRVWKTQTDRMISFTADV